MLGNERLTDGALDGTRHAYGTIKRMLAAGLVEERDERRIRPDDDRRRYYRSPRSGAGC